MEEAHAVDEAQTMCSQTESGPWILEISESRL